MNLNSTDIIKKADRLKARLASSDPHQIARALDITILKRPFRHQYGAYMVVLGNRFIFLKEDLPSSIEPIVIMHEIGHDQLHRREAVISGGFQEFRLFDMSRSRKEYEANLFAAQFMLPDEEFLSLVRMGYDTHQIAGFMKSDVNLVALKGEAMILKGHPLYHQEYKNDFLRE